MKKYDISLALFLMGDKMHGSGYSRAANKSQNYSIYFPKLWTLWRLLVPYVVQYVLQDHGLVTLKGSRRLLSHSRCHTQHFRNTFNHSRRFFTGVLGSTSQSRFANSSVKPHACAVDFPTRVRFACCLKFARRAD